MIVAICGRRRTGKDTLANALVRLGGFVHVKFADPLKAGARAIFGFTEAQVEHDSKDHVDPAWGVTPRQALQWLGTEVMQFHIRELLPHQGRDFWARQLVRRIQSVDGAVVVSDVRFLHEFQALKDAFGERLLVVRTTREGYVRDQTSDSHTSELDVDAIPADLELCSLAEIQAAARVLAEDPCHAPDRKFLTSLQLRAPASE